MKKDLLDKLELLIPIFQKIIIESEQRLNIDKFDYQAGENNGFEVYIGHHEVDPPSNNLYDLIEEVTKFSNHAMQEDSSIGSKPIFMFVDVADGTYKPFADGEFINYFGLSEGVNDEAIVIYYDERKLKRDFDRAVDSSIATTAHEFGELLMGREFIPKTPAQRWLKEMICDIIGEKLVQTYQGGRISLKNDYVDNTPAENPIKHNNDRMQKEPETVVIPSHPPHRLRYDLLTHLKP